MILNIVGICIALIVLALVIWVLDICATAVLNRIGVPEDIKRAARAVVALLLFLILLAFVLHLFGVLPAGWW